MLSIVVLSFFAIMSLVWSFPSIPKDYKVGLISTDDLWEKIQNKEKVIVIDARRKGYKEEHIPTAINVDYLKLTHKVNGVPAIILPNDRLGRALSKLGIKKDVPVVVYGSGSSLRDWTDATRVILQLVWAGVKEVYLLNGGIAKWIDEGKPIEKGELKLRPSKFVVDYNPPLTLASTGMVLYALKHLDEVQLVDARPEDRFTGEFDDPRMPRDGHIRGAKWLDTGELVWQEGAYYTLLEKEDIISLFEEKGIDINKPLIAYCGSGHVSSGIWFVMKAILGKRFVWVYEGGMLEASRIKEIPIVKGFEESKRR